MRVLLISDLHLQEERPEVAACFTRFLQERAPTAAALYILGDFFELWIGDDAMSAFHESIAAALKKLADSGTAVYLMHGNRDFMLGHTFCRKAGCSLLPDPNLITLGGEPMLLMHGDTLCTQDVQYLQKRAKIRSPLGLFVLKHATPLFMRQRLARKLRNESLERTPHKAPEIIDVTPSEAERLMRQYGVQTLIHGHTHRPAVHTFELAGKPARRIVLGDWDTQAWALEITQDSVTLAPFPIA